MLCMKSSLQHGVSNDVHLNTKGYDALQVCSQNVLTKILAVALFALPMVAATGYAYAKATGKGLGESMFHTYTVLQDTPGETQLECMVKRAVISMICM
jgi:hypothetical protein